MRRTVCGLVALVVLSASGSATASVEGPALYGFGGRVAMSDAGFAVTLPDDWLWLRRPAEGPESLDAVIDDPAMDPRLSSDLWAMRLHGLSEQADLVVSRGIDRVTSAGQARYYEPMCTFTLRADGWTLRDGVEDTIAAFDYPQVSEPQTRWLTLAGTPAVRVAIGPPMLLGDPDFATAAAAVYWLSDGSRLYRVHCGGSDVPADLWQSLIEKWEWLPADAPGVHGPSSPARLSPAHGWRLEAEEGGFAMDLPDHWWAPGYPHSVVGGAWADAAADVLDGSLSRWVSLVGPSSGCGVLTGRTDSDTAEAVLAGLDVDDAVPVALPAGPAVRIGPTTVGPTSQPLDTDAEAAVNGQAAYVIASSSRLAIIECAGTVPADRWLPVAEAFAFLPHGE